MESSAYSRGRVGNIVEVIRIMGNGKQASRWHGEWKEVREQRIQEAREGI